MAAPAVGAWITAFACTQTRAVPAVLPIVLGAISIVLLLVSGLVDRGRILATLAVCLAVGAAVATGASLTTTQRTPEILERAASGSETIDVVVEVSAPPQTLDGPSGRVVVDVTILEADASRGTASDLAVPAVLFVDGEGVAPQDVLGLAVRIEQGRTGDRAAFMLTAVGGTVATAVASPAIDPAGALRSGFVDAARTLPGDGGKLLPGLAVGETTLVDDALADRMTEASLSHLTAVSGANCALVVGAVLGVLSVCGSPRWVRVVGSLVALSGFVVLVTPEPSVVRASVMAGIVLVCHGIGRRSLGPPVLFLAVIVCLLLDPWLSREFGFALSVSATAGLLFLAAPLTALLHRAMPTVLAGAVAVPLAAQLACQPVVVLLDPSIPLWGIPANMLAAPAAPIVTILGMLACLVLPAVPPLGTVLLGVAWVPSQWIAGVAAVTDSAPLARLPGAPGATGVIVAAAVLVLIAVLAGSRSRRARRAVAATLVLAACCYVAVIGGSRIGQLWSRPDGWSIAMCDVGQGDAVVVRSEGRVALVDTGPDPAVLDRCLDDLGIGRIDLLVLSHFDADHVGGLAAVSGRATTVLHQPLREAADRALIAGLADAGSHPSETTAGAAGTLGRLPWRVLWPPPEPSTYTGNDGSVVIEFGGDVDAIFLGDLGADSELALLAEGTVRSGYAVVKVAHHGSADQYGALYDTISARLGLVSCGVDNDYGHPTSTALALLTRNGTAVARSDRDGTTLVARNDSELVTWSSGPSADHGMPGG
jgi:competence protein ComEC